MPASSFFVLFNLVLLQSSSVAVINFKNQVWPILERRCLECHKSPYEKNGILKKPKAGLRLDGAAHIMHGSDEGAVVVVNHPSRSSLYQRVILPEGDSDHMPPKGEPLSVQDKEILRMWIAQGVDFGTWIGATDGVDELTAQKKKSQLPQASYLKEIDNLSEGVNPVEMNLLDEISRKTGLLVRPLGIGSPLLEVRVVTEPSKTGDEMIHALASLKDNIVKVDLRGSAITDRSLNDLSSFPRLISLNLMGTPVTLEGIISLKETPRLKSLNLVNTMVTDSAAKELASFPHLQKLFLWNSKFTEKGISLLRSQNTISEINF
jgi:hypothetical protein